MVDISSESWPNAHLSKALIMGSELLKIIHIPTARLQDIGEIEISSIMVDRSSRHSSNHIDIMSLHTPIYSQWYFDAFNDNGRIDI